MNRSNSRTFSLFWIICLLQCCLLSCGYDSYLVGSSGASFEELFVTAHDILQIHYEFTEVDKKNGVLETQWFVVPNVDSFGSQRHRIRIQILGDANGGASVYLRVDLESREYDPLTRGVPDWIPAGRDPHQEEVLLDQILKSVR
ncbi:MAG: hypothetical protein AABZ60_19800 [Planctomycetota bacterium]